MCTRKQGALPRAPAWSGYLVYFLWRGDWRLAGSLLVGCWHLFYSSCEGREGKIPFRVSMVRMTPRPNLTCVTYAVHLSLTSISQDDHFPNGSHVSAQDTTNAPPTVRFKVIDEVFITQWHHELHHCELTGWPLFPELCVYMSRLKSSCYYLYYSSKWSGIKSMLPYASGNKTFWES